MKRLAALVTMVWSVASFADLPHASFGPVRPALPAPQVSLVTETGARLELPAALIGKVTAVQMMFTACTATCPIQGGLFAEVQRKLASSGPEFQLMSITIAPADRDGVGDTPAKMSAWLARYGARRERWRGAIPPVTVVDALLDFVRGRANGADRHTAQAYVFDKRGRLVFRSESMPDPLALVGVMKDVAALP